MIDEYELHQGIVLRQVIVGASLPVRISPFNRQGRINAFVLNEKIGVFIKHSSKRMSPWSFTFHLDQVSDLRELEALHAPSFISFVCGKDGVATISIETLHQLVSFDEQPQAWVRVSRKPRTLYSLSGNRNNLPNKLAQGIESIYIALQASHSGSND